MNLINPKSLLFILIVLTVGTVIFQTDSSFDVSEFDQWKSLHQINYVTDFENNYRRQVFLQNKAKMIQHNSNPFNTYKMGINQFSALTDEEFVQQHLSQVKISSNQIIDVEPVNEIQATDIDWTTLGAVGATKNQGQCAGAWVFSTTGPLQGLSKIADGTLLILSDQQLIDCASISGTGCNGGFPETGFKWVKLHGITTAGKYPYAGRQQTCQMNTGEFKIGGFTTINNCNDLSTSIHKGPVSVAVDASNWSRYASGIFTNCGTSLNHAATLVGQIQDNWKVQNSWGVNWGQNGFIRIGKGNTCGICMNGILPFK